MNQRQMIAAVTEKLNIKLDENDPAFVLVELNRLALDEAGQHIIDQLEGIPARINDAVDLSLSSMLAAIDTIDEQQKKLLEFYQTQPGLLTSEQETIPSPTDTGNGATENSSVKSNSDFHDANAVMGERLASIERELLKLYREKATLKTMKGLLEDEKRNFGQLSLWDRIFFKL
jgi:hypothetical protein